MSHSASTNILMGVIKPKYSEKINIKKGIEEGLIYLISIVLTNWDAIINQTPQKIRILLGLTVATLIKMGLNALKFWLKNRK